MRLRSYLAIARPDHWIKNIFVLPGVVFAGLLARPPWTEALPRVGTALLVACLVASANYVINEWLDAAFDRHHPVKKHRPSLTGGLRAPYVYLEYVMLLVVGLGLAWVLGVPFFLTALWLAVMGVLYNVRPFRTKDRAYVDVLSESVNNPIRLLMGWFALTSASSPPSSLLLGYWMGGAFLMATKRYAEFREIGAAVAALYRRSFRYYTLDRLLISIMFYGCSASFFTGVFLVKYRIEYIILLPFLAFLFAWYLQISFKPNSAAQAPERLFREKRFATFVLFIAALFLVLTIVDIPNLSVLVHGQDP
ncbi:MAG: UbiA prenyltransferase family protein [Myxococcales bacterium]|nr:UbiA prenyltransferase family protein [Myxococcales bacterium]